MFRAFATAATGMGAQQQMVDVTANNLANINTNGFKRNSVDFQDLLYIKLEQAGSETSAGLQRPTGFEVGSGVKAAATVRINAAGELVQTDRSTDVAIRGDGFLQVTTENGTRYTRDGALYVNSDGNLTTLSGYLIEPSITIPSTAVSIDIAKDGTVNTMDQSGTTSVAGTLQLAKFINPSGLESIGDNLLNETVASGSATAGTPGQNGLGTIQSGFLEKSNVQMITELVNLIRAQRAYEVNSRSIRAADEMLRKAIQIARF